MKARFAIVLLLMFVTVSIILGSDMLVDYMLRFPNLGWLVSYLTPKLLLLLTSGVLVLLILPPLGDSKRLKWGVAISVLGISVGAYCAVNVPYVSDWYAYGENVDSRYNGNPVEEFILRTNSDFDGLVCLVLPGCPYCNVAIGRLSQLKQRVPDLDLVVFVFTEDSSKVESFKHYLGSGELTFYPVPDPNRSMGLSRGSFPAFLYFRNGRFVHRWSNGQFGFPALDWVENRLQ